MSDDLSDNSALLDPELIAEFVDEAEEGLTQAVAELVSLEKNPNNAESLNSVFRVLHSTKGNAAFFGMEEVRVLSHRMEDTLAMMRSGEMHVSRRNIDQLLAGIDLLRVMLGQIRFGNPAVDAEHQPQYEQLLATIEELNESLIEDAPELVWPRALMRLNQICVVAEAEGSAWTPELKELRRELGILMPEEMEHEVAETLTAANRGGAAPTAASKAATLAAGGRSGGELVGAKGGRSGKPEPGSRTMRVDEVRIDDFLDYVGELIILRSMFDNVGNRLDGSGEDRELQKEYRRALEVFGDLSLNLQRSIMEIRRVPVDVVVRRSHRIVRDSAARLGKQAQAHLTGMDVAVDKSLLEAFEAPLTHIVRNAVAHGIEEPATRAKAGKERVGNIQIDVVERDESIIVTVSDDGAGIDAHALKQKAVGQGLIDARAAASMSDSDAYDLIFRPGLSTAVEVDELSGRGVGMDVVKSNVEALGGMIEVSSARGYGTTVTMLLPRKVVVKIIDGFLVRVSDQRFILPLDRIQESFRPEVEEVHSVVGEGDCVRRRGRLVSLVRLSDTFCLGGSKAQPSKSIVVVVEMGRREPTGLMVDEVLGVQQVVVREVDGVDVGGQVFSGGAVLGDGKVAMVVDVEQLAEVLG